MKVTEANKTSQVTPDYTLSFTSRGNSGSQIPRRSASTTTTRRRRRRRTRRISGPGPSGDDQMRICPRFLLLHLHWPLGGIPLSPSPPWPRRRWWTRRPRRRGRSREWLLPSCPPWPPPWAGWCLPPSLLGSNLQEWWTRDTSSSCWLGRSDNYLQTFPSRQTILIKV